MISLSCLAACSNDRGEPAPEKSTGQEAETSGDGGPESGVAAAPDFDRIRAEIASVMGAVFRADMAPLEKHTHERVIAMVGDKETFLAEMKKLFGDFKDQGIVLASAKVGEEIEYFRGEKHEFVLVPTIMTLKVAEEELPPVPGVQLGVRKGPGEDWKYIDCSSLTTEMAREWFEDFPEDKEIPATE